MARLIALVLMLCLGLSQAQDFFINSMEIRTADISGAGMDNLFGTIDMQIITEDFEICNINGLAGDGNNFQRGKVDIFSGPQLQSCNNFSIPNRNVAAFRITHHGIDAWAPEWVRFLFNGNCFVQCNDGLLLDNGQFHDLDCF